MNKNDKKIPILIIMCGLPGSGKSNYAKTLSKKYNAKVYSSDQIREEICENINDQTKNELVFRTLHKRLKEDLNNENNCIYDACSINRKVRKQIIREMKNIVCKKICVFMATPYTQCLENNQARNRIVPEHVIKKMYLNFDCPMLQEGFDDINIIYWKNSKNSYPNAMDWVNSMMSFNQDNKHHQLTLGEHCYMTLTNMEKIVRREQDKINSTKEMNLTVASLIHDNGKVFTKSFYNLKGELNENAHYYSHHNCGSYDSFFYSCENLSDDDHLYVAQLINWHMIPYLSWDKSEKSRKRDKNFLGDEMYQDICFLHEADVRAH